jgi:hypothetical protein
MNSLTRAQRIVVLVAMVMIVLVAVTAASASTSTVGAPGSGGARYRVVLEGFTVTTQTWDHALNADGWGDEVFASVKTAYLDKDGKQLVPDNSSPTRVMGDVGSHPERVQAGTANPWTPTGGLKSGDSFPNPPYGGADPGPSTGLTLPLEIWQGDLVEDQQAVFITPTMWEWDGTPDAFGDWIRWAQAAVPKIGKEVAKYTGGGGRADTIVGSISLGLDLALSLQEDGILGQAKDRPIGMHATGDKAYGFEPQVVVLNYDRAESLVNTAYLGVNGLVGVDYTDDAKLGGGHYTLFLRVEKVRDLGADETPPKVSLLPATVAGRVATVKWNGVDPLVPDHVTTGVESYDVKAKVGSGKWQTVVEETDDTQYEIAGKRRSQIQYRVRARDKAGNESKWSPIRTVRLK